MRRTAKLKRRITIGIILVSLLSNPDNVTSFSSSQSAKLLSQRIRRRQGREGNSSVILRKCSKSGEHEQIMAEIESVALELWGDQDQIIPTHRDISETSNSQDSFLEGEAKAEHDGVVVAFHERADYFHQRALQGCPKSQHSYGLLLWSGFAGVERDANDSAKYHAAAASQNHLDGMAVLGGCLRTGTGVKQNVGLGLKIIDYCASKGNPTGINKKGALLESNQDDFAAVQLYQQCIDSGRVNALLLFNLGWCLVNGHGVKKKDRDGGIKLWKEATANAPDEGSEEAAFNLHLEYIRDDPAIAKEWLQFAEELGYYE